MASLTGKVAIVTGSSRGIGRAIAERLGREGASVVVTYVQSAAQAEDVVAAITACGSQAIAVQADMGQRANISQLFQATLHRFGRLERIGKINGIFTLPLPPLASGPPLPAAAAHAQHRRLPQAATAARRSGAQQGVVRLCAAGHAV